MAHCIHGTHWDGISPFYCDQCAVNATGSVAAYPFTFTVVVPNIDDWKDAEDEWTAEIKAAHPARTDSHHHEYATAMRMVGNRHSKGALVALVTWLLIEKNRARQVTEGT
jgi:hypothetical protein